MLKNKIAEDIYLCLSLQLAFPSVSFLLGSKYSSSSTSGVEVVATLLPLLPAVTISAPCEWPGKDFTSTNCIYGYKSERERKKKKRVFCRHKKWID
jgi:hypothetical protein